MAFILERKKTWKYIFRPVLRARNPHKSFCLLFPLTLDVALATLQVYCFCFTGHLALLRSGAEHILSFLSCDLGNYNEAVFNLHGSLSFAGGRPSVKL